MTVSAGMADSHNQKRRHSDCDDSQSGLSGTATATFTRLVVEIAAENSKTSKVMFLATLI